MNAATLSAHELTVRVGKRELISTVSCTVQPGEVLAIVGPNGAGKSTLLSALAGDITAHHGHITLDDRALSRYSTIELARRRAVLTQHTTVAFGFTVAELVAMGRAPWPDTDDTAVQRAMSDTQVTEFADRRYSTLSGGEQARVQLARILAQDTPILLLDEPTAALDLRHVEEVLTITKKLASDGRAIAVVLHDLATAAAYADRILVLQQGKVAALGAPADVLDAALLSTVYGCPVEIVTHPRTGGLLVLPVREPFPSASTREQ